MLFLERVTAETDYKLVHSLLLQKNLCSPDRIVVRQVTPNPVVGSLMTLSLHVHEPPSLISLGDFTLNTAIENLCG